MFQYNDSKKLECTKDFDDRFPQLNFLFSFQKAAVEYYIKYNLTFVLFALPPGLGKTLIAIAIMMIQSPRKIVVVCPVSVLLNWKRELEKYTSLKVQILKTKKDKIDESGNVFLCSFAIGSCSAVRNKIDDIDLLVIDESHYLKNPKAVRTKGIFSYKVKRILALTGTPIVNRPIEIHPILFRYCPMAIDNLSYFKFGIKYCAGFKSHWGWDFSGAKNLEDLGAKLRFSCMYRIKKEDALPQLPDKISQIISFNNADYDCKAFEHVEVKDIEIHVGFEEIMKERQKISEAKRPMTIEFIKDLLEQEDKIVVFAHFKETINFLEEELKEYLPLKIDGSTTMERRQKICDIFQGSLLHRVFIGSIQACGVGITLTASSTVVFAESDWVSGNNEQAIDRCHRIGQKSSVHAYFLTIGGSIEEYMLRKVIEKDTNIKRIMQ